MFNKRCSIGVDEYTCLMIKVKVRPEGDGKQRVKSKPSGEKKSRRGENLSLRKKRPVIVWKITRLQREAEVAREYARQDRIRSSAPLYADPSCQMSWQTPLHHLKAHLAQIDYSSPLHRAWELYASGRTSCLCCLVSPRIMAEPPSSGAIRYLPRD